MMYFRHEDYLHIFRFRDSRRETVDAWQRILRELVDLYTPTGGHLCSLYDIRGLWLTPYAVKTALEISQAAPKVMFISMVMLVNDSLGISLAQSLLNRLAHHKLKARRIMTDEAAALEWLAARHRQFLEEQV